ncbi:MAG: putative sulfate exporter family transporter [Halarcobacter sp.]
MNKIYGLVLTTSISLLAMLLSKYIALGSVTLAIILGTILGNTVRIPKKFNSGISFSEKALLALAISLMGINLDFNVLRELGINTILLIIITLIATLAFAIYLTKKLKFDKDLGLILGIGSAICGSAAIAATKDILNLEKQKTAIAIAIVNILGTFGLFALPLLGYLIGFSDIEIGILLGNTLQSVGHAIAAGFGVNETVGQSATIVKMGRILLLTPVILWLIYVVVKKKTNKSEVSSKFQVPIFVFGFIFFSILASTHLLPTYIIDAISYTCKVSLLLAMSAIGLKISFRAIKESGWDAFVLTSYIFIFQILLTVSLIFVI